MRLSRFLAACVLCFSASGVWAQDRLFCESPATPAIPLSGSDLLLDPDKVHMFADRAELSKKGDISISGNVEVRQGERVVGAGEAEFDPDEGKLTLQKDVRFRQPGVGITSERAQFDYGSREIGFSDSTFSLPDRPARGAAKEILIRGEGTLDLDGIEFTTCPPGIDDWKLKARALDLDLAKGVATGRGVRINFKGVPILYTPFISFPISDIRKSGFLLPDFNTSDRTGTDISIPYYLNLAPNYDLTLTPRVMSRRGILLGTEFRYLTRSSFGMVDLQYLPDDRRKDEDRSFASIRHQTDFPSYTRTTLFVDNASDSQYFEDFGQSLGETSLTHLDRRLRTEHLGRHWSLLGLAQDYQTIDSTIPRDMRPYQRLPQVVFEGLWPYKAVDVGVKTELVNYHRDVGVTGLRFDFTQELRVPWDRGSYYVTPGAAWHYIGYDLGDVGPGQDTGPSVSVPEFSLNTGLRFERQAGKLGKLMQTLEPRILYVYIPFREQDDLPVFDTGLADFNTVQLFRRNRFVGGDRIGDSNTVSLGVTSRLLDGETGKQILTATIGQAYYIDDQRVTLPGEQPRGDSSDVIAEVDLNVYKNWNVGIAYQFNTDIDRTDRAETRFQFRPDDNKVLSMGYRFRRAQLEQYDVSFAWPVAQRWDMVGRWLFALDESESLDRFFGIQYRSCCWGLRVVARRHIIRRTGESDTSIALQLELKGFTNVGDSAAEFLERGILGYSNN